MNKLDALRIFCLAAETQNFRKTAHILGVAPQAVTRTIHVLEQEFGEMLFIRNTRNTCITPFGRQLYHEAKAALLQTDGLFQRFSLHERTREEGLVRVEMPQADYYPLLPAVLRRLREYPGIVLDWRNGNQRSNTYQDQVDIGVRIGSPPVQDFIVRNIAALSMQTAMSPELIARLGEPRSVEDLRANYPLAVLVNNNDGKPFTWDYPGGSFVPENPAFIGNQVESLLQATLQGCAVCQLSASALRRYVRTGELKAVLPGEEMTIDWQIYVYRPYRHQQTARVKRVFDILVEELERFFAE